MPRSESAKNVAFLRDIVSVKRYYAVGDGATDDSAAIQAADDAHAAVFFPPGAFMANNLHPGTGSTGNRTWYGCGSNISIIKGNSAVNPVINANYSHFNLQLQDLAVSGNNIAPNCIVLGDGVTLFAHDKIINCRIYSATTINVKMERGAYVDIVDCQITDSGDTGTIGLQMSNMSVWTLTRSRLYNHGIALDIAGLGVAKWGQNGRVTDCDFWGPYTVGTHYVRGQDNNNIVFTRCTFENEITFSNSLVLLMAPTGANQTCDWAFVDCRFMGLAAYTQNLVELQNGVAKVRFFGCRAIVPGAPGKILVNNAQNAFVTVERCFADTGYQNPTETFWGAANCTTGASCRTEFLDDKEGEWTPSLTFGGAAVNMTYSAQNGTWQRHGNRVTINGVIVLTAKGTSVGDALIEGLPYGTIDRNAVLEGYRDNFSGAYTPCHATSGSSATTIALRKQNGASIAALTEADFTDTTRLDITATYRIAP